MSPSPAGAAPTLARAVLLAVAASLLWAAAIVLIKLGLEDIPRLTFASLRYLVGAVTLLIWRAATTQRGVPRFAGETWRWLFALAVLLYAVVPATQFISLDLVEAVTFNFVFQAGIPLVTALLAGVVLREPTSRWEWAGVFVVVLGIFMFYPAVPSGSEATGIIFAVVAAIGIGGSNLLQRIVMRSGEVAAVDAAVIPMTIGSLGLLALALSVESFPDLGAEQIVLILVLGVVNTALAFTLWHHAMRTLNALHAGVIASGQVVEVPILALLVLGESLTAGRGFGSVFVLGGILVVHFSKAAAARSGHEERERVG